MQGAAPSYLRAPHFYGSIGGMRRWAFILALTAGTCLPGLGATAPVLLVQGTVSTPNAAERNAAKAAARRLDRWLTHLGIPRDVIDDAAAADGIPRSVHVVILGYNPVPPPEEIAALKRFLDRGGKLLAFYTSAPELAAAAGVRFGPYTTSGMDPRWAVMRFNAAAPPHLPARIRQDSRSLRPVYPLAEPGRVIAHWETESGAVLDEPAWVGTDRCFWMAHILLDDGDSAAKERMLLGLLGALHPPLWAEAAKHALQTAGTLGRYAGFPDTAAAIRRRAGGTATGDVDAALQAADTVWRAMQRAHGAHRDAEVVALAQELDARVLDAYARLQPPRNGERRGVWNHSGLGLYPGDWPRTCRFLAEHGITDLYPNMLWPGLAHYPSRVLTRSDTATRYGDQMLQCSTAARRAGLRVHVWKVCWKTQFASEALKTQWRRDGRCQVNSAGETVDWLCPSHPANPQLEMQAVAELLDTYPVDGLHLDYMRRPDSTCCFCPSCRRAFEKALGKPVPDWPADVRSGHMKTAYTRWRATQLTQFVGRMAALARSIRPEIEVSAAVYGAYPGCIASIAQDWGAWLRSGAIDFACPMNYTDNRDQFTIWSQNQVDSIGGADRLYPGIGVTSSQSRLSPLHTLDQIQAVRRLGFPGFVLFDLTPVLETETLPVLRLGATRHAGGAP
jgi:uncharacterized lipoprotein YddW (UPF0748 family)